jgi:polyisoprenoid-binding protein YceI
MATQNFNIVTSASNIDWVGRKVTGAHNGSISIKEGTFTFTDGQLVGGRFVIDTTSITIEDVTDPVTNAQFAGHLASDDFFNAANYPEAVFEITHVTAGDSNRYHIDGHLTIKGITQALGFDALLAITDDTLQGNGNIVVDRTLFGMRFRSGNFFKDLGDTLIYNNFDLHVTITAKS